LETQFPIQNQTQFDSEQRIAPPIPRDQQGENFRVGSGITGVARPD